MKQQLSIGLKVGSPNGQGKIVKEFTTYGGAKFYQLDNSVLLIAEEQIKPVLKEYQIVVIVTANSMEDAQRNVRQGWGSYISTTEKC